VIDLKGSQDVLSSVIKTAQMGQIGIRSVLNAPLRASLKDALRSQLREYDAIESEAHAIATQRGWELPELDPARRFLSDAMVRMKLTRGNCDSKIADMMILFNTKGMIKGLRILNNFTEPDPRVSILCRKLLDCENACIRQMQEYL
jgi:hypothetical protein